MELNIKGYILLIAMNVLVPVTFSVLQDDGGSGDAGSGAALFLFSVGDQYSDSSLVTETPEAILPRPSLAASTIISTETLGSTVLTSSVAVTKESILIEPLGSIFSTASLIATTTLVAESGNIVSVTSQHYLIPSSMSTTSPIVLPTSTLPLTTLSTSLFMSTSSVSPRQTLPVTSMTQPSSMAISLTTGVNRLNQFSSTFSASGSHSIALSNTDDMPGVPLPVLIAVPAGALVLVSAVFILIVLCCVHCRRRRKYTIKTAEDSRLSGDSDQGQRSATPAMQDLKELTVDNSKNIQGLGMSEQTTAATFGIEFPETPKYGSNEEIPALIILNPVKPNVEPLSNAQWSQTLPSRQKIRKQTCSESDAPDRQDIGVLKPAKSMDAIDTMTRASDMVNNINNGTSTTLLLPEIKRKSAVQRRIEDEDEYDHLSPEDLPDGTDACLGSTGYVFLEPAEKSLLEKAESSVSASVGPGIDKDAIYLQPSSMPVPSQPPQPMVPTDPTPTSLDTEGVYDTPRSSGIDVIVASMLASHKQSTNSGIEANFSTSKESPVEVPSHYDVPKSVLSAFRDEAPKKLRFSTQPNSGTHEASLILNSPQENHYDSLGINPTVEPNSPPYYDIPKHLLRTKNSKTFDNAGEQDDDFEQETNMDDVELESSGEHVYCVPPDVVMNIIKNQKQKPVQAQTSQHDSDKTVKKLPQQQESMQVNPDSARTDTTLANKPQQQEPLQVKASKPDPPRTDNSLLNKPKQQEPMQVKESKPHSPKIDTSSVNKSEQQKPIKVKASKPDSARTNISSASKPQQHEPVQNEAPKPDFNRTEPSLASKTQQHKPLRVKTSEPKSDSTEVVNTSAASKVQLQTPVEAKPSKPDFNSAGVVNTSSIIKPQQQKPVENAPKPDSDRTNATNSSCRSKPQQHIPMQEKLSQPDSDGVDGVATSLVSKPVPMKRKKNDASQRNSVVPTPRPAKRPTNLAKNTSGSVSSSLEDLLQEQEPNKNTTVPASKPAVAKKPKVLPKNSTGSAASSSEDLLQLQRTSKRNDAKVLVLKPAIAKKPKKLPKGSSGSITSSQEELLRESEASNVFGTKNVTVNGETSDVENICDSPSQEGPGPLKPKPKVLPRSQSRQAIVSANVMQELVTKQAVQQTNESTPNEIKLNTFSVVPDRPPVAQKSLLKVSADS